MSRNTSEITQRDLDFMKLCEQIRKVIKTKKDWSAFKRYMKDYYDVRV